jgi:DNA-binding NarL/FixJ family response regulator
MTTNTASRAAAPPPLAMAEPSSIESAHLTPTELKVLQGVRSGLLNKQIAFDLGITEATVKAHMTALMRKLKVRNRTQVALAAQKFALVA